MTKDEAKELTNSELMAKIVEHYCHKEATIGAIDKLVIIRENWPQISEQLDKWFTIKFTIGPPVTRIHWTEAKEILEDPIGWMLRAFVASSY